MRQFVNVMKLNVGLYIPGMGIVNAPKRIYWVSNSKWQGWLINPYEGQRERYPVRNVDECGIMYVKAIRALSANDKPLRNARLIETRERTSKTFPVGLAGVSVTVYDYLRVDGTTSQRLFVRANGFGILGTKAWRVTQGKTLGHFIQMGLDYRRRAIDLWHQTHEMTVEDATTPRDLVM